MKPIQITWSNRPAAVIEVGPECSQIMWLDTQTEQAINNAHYTIVKSDISMTDLINAHKPKKEGPKRATSGPTKGEKANAIYVRLKGQPKAVVMEAIIAECGMSAAGAQTYYYNAKKAAGN